MISFVHLFIFVSILHIINMLRVFCPFHFHFIFNQYIFLAPYAKKHAEQKQKKKQNEKMKK